jgi:hypothetical protein
MWVWSMQLGILYSKYYYTHTRAHTRTHTHTHQQCDESVAFVVFLGRGEGGVGVAVGQAGGGQAVLR